MNAVPHIEDFTDDYNPATVLLTIGGEGNITEPLQELARLRRRAPVMEGDLQQHFGLPRQSAPRGNKAYMVLSYAACNEAALNQQDFSNSGYKTSIGLTFGKSITTMDAPEHGKYRRLFQAAFTPKMLAVLRPRFEALVARLVGNLEGRGEADLVRDLAFHFPFQFICDLMDLPMEDRPVFQKLAIALIFLGLDRPHSIEASEKLGRYLSALIAQRRRRKSETDFVSVIANAEIDGERLPEDVLLGFFRQLMNAGGDTSYHSFSNILSALFTHPAQLDAIRKDRSLIPRAIEEGLRWGAPITATERVTARDVVLCGVPMEGNCVVRVCIGAANRDESVWQDPDKFDIFREQKRQVAFGYGAHVCIGQHLARMELQLALNTLLDRLPNVRLDPDKPAPVIRGLTFRSADAVHVKWN
jgi:cytochrome P450